MIYLGREKVMSKTKNNLDERQELKLLEIEHHGTWFTFWGLLAAILIQLIIGGEDLFRHIVGEWIVFMCLAIYICIACLKNGIWDRKLQPNLKTNTIVSLISGSVCGIVFFASSYIKYQKLVGSIFTGLFILITVFALTFAVLTILASIYKKRTEKLERYGEE